MRTASIYTVTCHQCGKTLESESKEMVCGCGARVVVEWPCVTRMEATGRITQGESK